MLKDKISVGTEKKVFATAVCVLFYLPLIADCILFYFILCQFKILTFCNKHFVLSPINQFFNVLCSLNLLYHISYLFLTVSH